MTTKEFLRELQSAGLGSLPGTAAEILDDGRYGRLVPMNDAAALALAIRESLAEQSDSDRLRERGWRRLALISIVFLITLGCSTGGDGDTNGTVAAAPAENHAMEGGSIPVSEPPAICIVLTYHCDLRWRQRFS